MKKHIYHIDIPKPCKEGWNNMQPSSNGRYCNSCQKIVKDFTDMNTAEIAKYLQENYGTPVCGRFKKVQLDKNYIYLEKQPVNNFKYVAAITAGLLIAENIQAQNSDTTKTEISQNPIVDSATTKTSDTITIKGIVKDKATGETLIGVNISEENTTNGVVSDKDGNFSIEVSENSKLKFDYVGYESQIISADKIKENIPILLKEGPMIVGDVIIVEGSRDPVYNGVINDRYINPRNKRHKRK